MIQRQLKLRPTKDQETILKDWLWILTGAWNTAVRRIGQDAGDGVYYSEFDVKDWVAGHSKRIGVPSHTLQAVFAEAHQTWSRCFKKLAKRPRLKSIRRPLSSIPFPDPVKERP